MKISELIYEEEFDKIREEVFRFTEDMLQEYTAKVYDVGGKEIFDAVWGPVEFNSAEVAILDSPLLQRLRKIKQLGLASYVYCDADYSRFSHTIGVFFLAERMARIIHKKARNTKFSFVEIAKMSALFHDTGHMYFSHVSEYYFLKDETFRRYREVKEAIVRFSEVIDKNVALHEMLSVIIVQAPATKQLLKKIATWMDDINIRNDKDLDDLIEYICCMILGVANDEEMLPYYQIINGSVDADKCDYLSRDSHSTNVPVAVDIERLIHKLTVEEENFHGQTSQIWNGDDGKKVYYLPAIKESAEEALNQLLMARTIMFKSVYYHQKVRTAEVTLRSIFAELNQIGVKETNDFYYILKTTDSFFDDNCYELLKRKGNSDEDDIYNNNLKTITEKLYNLNNRFLLKRACALSNECIIANKHNKYRFEREIFKLTNRAQILQIEKKTFEEYQRICDLVGRERGTDDVFTIVEYPKYSPDNSKLDTRISYGNGQTQKASEVFQSETWMGSKESRHKDYYLATNCKSRELAFLAIQKVIYDMYNVVLDKRASVYSKVPIKDIRNVQRDLLKKGYYNSAAVLVQDILLPKYSAKIKEIAQKFQTYEGENGRTIDEERITAYLKQYLLCDFLNYKDAELLLDGIVRILKKALFINRRLFDDSIRELFSKFEFNPENMYVCPLGGMKDSAKHMTYYFNDFKDEFKEMKIKSSLQEIFKEKQTDSTIVFFDDGAYSGTQVLSVFQEYMNIPIGERETQESHVDGLSAEEQELLKKQKIILAYICFNREKEEHIIEGLEKLGLKNVEIKFSFDMTEKLFSDSSKVFADEQQKEVVKKYLSIIGKEILYTAKREADGQLRKAWTDSRIEESKLGYNDAQQAVILKSNVPTYTITAIWMKGGKYKGEDWIPLFGRTDK